MLTPYLLRRLPLRSSPNGGMEYPGAASAPAPYTLEVDERRRGNAHGFTAARKLLGNGRKPGTPNYNEVFGAETMRPRPYCGITIGSKVNMIQPRRPQRLPPCWNRA